MLFQPPIPPQYHKLADADLLERIAARKRQLGRRVVILGHHYQADDVIRFADYTGDSFKLSRQAATEARDAEFIIFCGVHFMAESADILASDGQQVILPDLSAGCSMADMAELEQVLEAWDALAAADGSRVVPICYVNSSAAIKAFVGRHGGTACTSSNAERALAWALGLDGGANGDGDAGGIGETTGGAHPFGMAAGRNRVLFIPDQHLGRNTAYAMGFPLDSMIVWDPHEPGGPDPARLRQARFILWKGHCSVHQLFLPEHVDQVRAQRPGIRVIVHPECRWEVVQKADLSGSTEKIIQTIEQAKPGSEWAVGTEIHLVKRLADRFAGVTHVQSLSDCQCLCTTMYRIDPRRLLWVLDNLAEGRVVNRISVDEETKQWARVALDRMLALPGPTALAGAAGSRTPGQPTKAG